MVYGVGYCSKGNYSNPKDKCFLTWRNMLKRCYSTEDKYLNYRLQGVTVCEEWKDYAVFKEWFDRNYYSVNDENMQLDKDILTHGNKMYSPENCIFVPEKINRLFVFDKMHRGNLPIGVTYDQERKQYMSSCSVDGKNIKAYFNNQLDAFYEYKRVKEEYICKIAEEYKSFIPQKLYVAMKCFEIDIDD